MSDRTKSLLNAGQKDGYLAVIEALSADCSVDNLINECQRLIGDPVQLLNDSFEIIAASSNDTLPVADEKWQENTEIGRLQRECIENLRANKVLSCVNQSDEPVHVVNASDERGRKKSDTWICRTTHIGQVTGYLVVLACYRSLGPEDEQLLGAFAKAISIAKRIEHNESNLISTRAEALVERLLATPVTNGAVIELTRRINQLKLLPGNEFVLVSVRMDEQKAGGIPLNYYRNQLQLVFNGAHVFSHESDLFCLIRCTEPSRMAYLPENMYRSLERFLSENSFYAAISRVFPDLSFIKKAYRETDAALRLAKHLNLEYKLHHYERNMAFYPLLAYESEEEVRDLCHPGIMRVYEHDCQRGSDLLHTLDVYFANNLNISQTTAELNLHRNSLYYRIEKIEELIGRELGKDSKLDFQLQYSILVLKFLKVIPLDKRNLGV